MKTTMEMAVAVVVIVTMVCDERHHWPATFAGRPGMTNTRRVAMVEFAGKEDDGRG